ncbi:MAG: gluconate 2-dehydrogenase subunit 3 family protein [Flavobacteriaceae bacterium]|nr:gluconate 2-dehydrogenase subunit 3 family protein [Flavobacteriaceae bacterium]
MDRRKALKNIGLGAGFLVATPTIMSLLQSCNNEPEFIPVFFSQSEGHALRRMVDLIIPSDENVPGAVDVGVHSFIDKYCNEVMDEEDQAMIRAGWTAIDEKFKSTFEKELSEGKPEDFTQLLDEYLKTSEEEQKAFGKKMGEFMMAFENDPSAKPDSDALIFSTLAGLRGITIWGWKSSEEIGKNVLWYDPVPGQQKGCIPLSEAGNGNVMAL